MNKKIKATFVISLALFIWWAVLFFSHTKEQQLNYWWQAALAVAAIIFGVFGMLSAKKWSWLKSGVGQGLFFISLGLITWGLGQAGWTYYVIKYPGEEVPTATILDILYFSTIPLWTIGILRLSKATGAKYGLKSFKGKLLAFVISAIMIVVSYYFLVIVARGGTEYFQQPFIDTFWDLGYAIGDAINLTLALVIFGLSWKLLGGKFRKPILVILAAFGITYLADFAFSYYDGQGLYYNGDKSDLLYLLMITTFAVGLSMFDPARSSANTVAAPAPTTPPSPEPLPPAPVAPTQLPQQPVAAVEPALIQTPVVTVAEPTPMPVAPVQLPQQPLEAAVDVPTAGGVITPTQPVASSPVPIAIPTLPEPVVTQTPTPQSVAAEQVVAPTQNPEPVITPVAQPKQNNTEQL